ncbi:MAG: (S)-ureidoglycine aminohydrolase [Pseudomonadota bacterium]
MAADPELRDILNPGISRSSVQRDHALITPESHVPVLLPGWDNAEAVVLISAEMGAKFGQLLAYCHAGSTLRPLSPKDEYFILALEGTVTVHHDTRSGSLDTDHYVYLPSGLDWRIESAGDATLMMFRKPYVPIAGHGAPAPFMRALADVPAEPFLGDEGALLQTLLPDDPAWDWGINLFEFVPGGTLPNVENHFMEHGLYLLGGQGVYRLGDHWYPVQAGDCIWMGPYLLQWYVAAGKTNSRYIYYKEMNRAPLG